MIYPLVEKKKMKIQISFIIAFFIIISCQQNAHENINVEKVITFNREQMESISKDIDSVAYFPLESNQMAYYSNSSKVIFHKDKIFIGDFFLHKIVVYNSSGKFLYAINNRGRASNEFLEIKSFCVTDHEIAIIDNINHLLKIYDVKTGRFLVNKTMPFVAWDVEGLNNGGYVFAFSSLQKEYNPNKMKYRLFFTDDNLNIIKKIFPYKKNEIDPIGKMTYFSSSPDKIIFHWCGANYYSVIDRSENDSIKMIAVDFGAKQVPDEYREDIRKIDQGGYYYIYSTPVTNGKYIAFEIVNGDTTNTYLYSNNDDVMKTNYDEESMVMPYPLCVDEQGRFIYLLNTADEYELLVKDGFPRASKEIEDHIRDNGLTILSYMTK